MWKLCEGSCETLKPKSWIYWNGCWRNVNTSIVVVWQISQTAQLNMCENFDAYLHTHLIKYHLHQWLFVEATIQEFTWEDVKGKSCRCCKYKTTWRLKTWCWISRIWQRNKWRIYVWFSKWSYWCNYQRLLLTINRRCRLKINMTLRLTKAFMQTHSASFTSLNNTVLRDNEAMGAIVDGTWKISEQFFVKT